MRCVSVAGDYVDLRFISGANSPLRLPYLRERVGVHYILRHSRYPSLLLAFNTAVSLVTCTDNSAIFSTGNVVNKRGVVHGRCSG